MAVSMQDVIFALGSDEPDYARAASLGQEALPYLEQLINSGSRLAPKATYLAGHIQDRASVDVLANAARRGEPEISGGCRHGRSSSPTPRGRYGAAVAGA